MIWSFILGFTAGAVLIAGCGLGPSRISGGALPRPPRPVPQAAARLRTPRSLIQATGMRAMTTTKFETATRDVEPDAWEHTQLADPEPAGDSLIQAPSRQPNGGHGAIPGPRGASRTTPVWPPSLRLLRGQAMMVSRPQQSDDSTPNPGFPNRVTPGNASSPCAGDARSSAPSPPWSAGSPQTGRGSMLPATFFCYGLFGNQCCATPCRSLERLWQRHRSGASRPRSPGRPGLG